MRAKQFIRRINEGADESSVITSEVIKLISDGHTEVSPDVITAKVSAALGRPFMLKDLVSANNSSPELQHYIDSINPSKIKFSTDILTVKNQDPMKEKQAARDGVAKMAARAGGRPRLGESVVNEATQEELWQGWKIRYETTPQIKGQPLRWMTWHTKRGTESAHEGQANTPQEAVEAAKAWIQSGGNAKDITTSSTVTIDFNVKFATDIANGNEFYARIVKGPTLLVSNDAKPGFKRSHIRTQQSKATQNTTLLPVIALSSNEANAAGLKAHGRYVLGDTQQLEDGTLAYPLIYQSTVQAKGDMMRLGKPGLTVAMNREASGLEETDQGISGSAETKFHKKLDTLVHDTFGRRKEEMKEGWGRGNDRVSLPDEPALYWSGKGPLQNEYNDLYEKLVPSQGAADTIEGEVLRAASKIVYRHYNDGDEFNQASFDQLEPYIGAVTSYDDLAHKSTEFAIKANGNYTPNTGWDSLDVMEYGPEEYDDDDYDEDDGWDEEEEDTSWDQEDDDEDLDESKIVPVHHVKQGVAEGSVDRDEDLREYDDWSDDVDDEDEDQGFFVAISSEDDGVFIGMVVKEDGKWRERRYKGNPPYNWGGTYMGYLTPQDVMTWINKDYGRSYEVEGPMDEDEANEYLDMMSEGWESGPDERAPRERDPDWEYDQRRQEKMDIEAEKAQAQRPQEQYYTLVGRGPNYEANYAFPGEYATQDEAVAARAKLMADPSTPNPRDIGISKRTRYLDIKEGRETPLRDKEDYAAKKKALQDIQSDPSTAQDPELSVEVMRRLAGLKQQAKAMGLEESRKK